VTRRLERSRQACGIALLVTLAGCNLAPRYSPPKQDVPDGYKEATPFQRAHPNDLGPKTAWWEDFGDARLNQLETQLVAQNPDLAAMTESYTQARDLVAEARARLYPQLTAGAALGYERESVHTPFRNLASDTPVVAGDNRIALSASWEADIWGQIRNQVHRESRLAQASAATLAALRLSLEAELADDYAALRGEDAQIEIYRSAVASYAQAVQITTLRFHGKIASGIDVQRSQSQLAATEQLLEGSLSSRALLEHAIAALAGSNPSSFSMSPDRTLTLALPETPVSLPSVLLERRPDVAAAERRMAAANAAIGVAKAAFYPQIVIFAGGGFEDTGFNLASLPNSLWSIGSELTLPLFEGGLRRAELQRTWSAYAETRDDYRSIVLAAFKDVEDRLAETVHLRTQVEKQTVAAAAADNAEGLAMQLYVGGLTNYLDVVVAQETALSAHIVATQLGTARYLAAIGLIRALGGGWDVKQLPSERDVVPFGPLDYTAAREPPPR
jgi:outer membrane protein, multidrug efflux system